MKVVNTGEFLCPILLIQLIFVTSLTKISNGEMRSFVFVDDLSKFPEYEVLEGDTINLICLRESTDSDIVEIEGKHHYYVTDGELIQSLQGIMTFTKNESVVILTFHNIRRDNGDTFICKRPSKYLILKVLYSPTDDPLVTSHYTPQYFCDDDSHGPFQFNCTTEVGVPPVNISLYIEKEGRLQPVNSADYDITRTDNFINLYLVTYLNSSFNEARLVCSITQYLPVPYENYQTSRFFELSPRASLHIHPSNYTIPKEGEVITLTCTSNVSGFVLEWTDIHLNNTQYNISSANDSITLETFEHESIVNGSKIVQCRGSCGGTVMLQDVTISLNNRNLEGNDGTGVKNGDIDMSCILSPIITACIVIAIIIPLAFAMFVVLKCKTKLDETIRAGSVNQNNGNSIGLILPADREQSRYSEAESNQNGKEMINVSIDEKETIEGENQVLTVTDNISQKSNSSIEMIENPKYEPYKPKIECGTNGKDDDYATVC